MQGILFIEPLYNQTKIDLKNQTRRTGGLDKINENPDGYELLTNIFQGSTGRTNVAFRNLTTGENIMCQAKYNAGEDLFLKEPIHIHPISKEVLYKYDGIHTDVSRWSNKLFMGRIYAREFIKITKVSIGRLLDISEEDCIAEGVEASVLGGKTTYKDYMGRSKFSAVDTPKESFLSVYALANKGSKSPKVANPWCWKYEFIRITKTN